MAGLVAAAFLTAGARPVRSSRRGGRGHRGRGHPPAATPLDPAPGAAGRPLVAPAVYTSHHGVLDVTLVASQQRVMIAGRRVLAKVYNGSFVAPTLIAAPGDLVRVKLVDHLDEPTNLHFHGLEVSPSGHADNIFVSVDPGHSFQYRFRLPHSAPTGTFWYHSHEMVPMSEMGRFPDAGSEEQVFDGLSGLLEVKGIDAAICPRRCAGSPSGTWRCATSRWPGGAIVDTDINSNAPTTRLVDGQLRPRLTIAPGQTQLWHIANIGADIFYRLALPGHTFEVVAQDGHPVIHAQRVSTLLLPPGKRWDVLVRGGSRGIDPAGDAVLRRGRRPLPGDDRWPPLVTTGRAAAPVSAAERHLLGLGRPAPGPRRPPAGRRLLREPAGHALLHRRPVL